MNIGIPNYNFKTEDVSYALVTIGGDIQGKDGLAEKRYTHSYFFLFCVFGVPCEGYCTPDVIDAFLAMYICVYILIHTITIIHILDISRCVKSFKSECDNA